MADIYYETPRLPMFMLMEERNIARIRTIRYVDGKLDAVLADWDAGILQAEFYGKEEFDDEDEEPFYCLIRDKEGRLLRNGYSIESWAEYTKGREHLTCNVELIIQDFMEEVKRMKVPVFNSIEEARDYVFQR